MVLSFIYLNRATVSVYDYLKAFDRDVQKIAGMIDNLSANPANLPTADSSRQDSEQASSSSSRQDSVPMDCSSKTSVSNLVGGGGGGGGQGELQRSGGGGGGGQGELQGTGAVATAPAPMIPLERKMPMITEIYHKCEQDNHARSKKSTIDVYYIQRNTRLVLLNSNVHRLVLASLVVAAKYTDDHYYSNLYYAKVGGVPVHELNALEAAFLRILEFSLYVSTDEYNEVLTMLQNEISPIY